MSASKLRLAVVGLVTCAMLASCTSDAALNEQKWEFCTPDGWTFLVDSSAQRVLWEDVRFAYGPACTGRCLEGFEAVAEALKKTREGKATFGTWQANVNRMDGVDERYNFSIRADYPNDLVVSSPVDHAQIYRLGSRFFGCEFGGRI